MSPWRLIVACALVSLLGCQEFALRSQSPDVEPASEEFDTKVETPLIGEFTSTAGRNLITLQGVGLVTGLDGTGEDPPVSVYRTTLLNDMRRRGITNPNQILADPSTAMVVVRAYLPPLIRKGETFDVEVRLPPNSTAKSLEGGWLMDTYLAEHAMVPGQGMMKGHVFAKAEGSILVSNSVNANGDPEGLVKRGRILAGGRSLKDRELSLFLKGGFRSVRNSKRIADRIALRFFHYNSSGLREPLAEAKTDQKIELRLHPRYKENFTRYLDVIRSIAFRETDVAQRVRMQQLQDQLFDPTQAERAAIQLEAIGNASIPVLKNALQSPLLECRFHAAVALAYLGDASGIDALTESARSEPAFRIFALAAMATVDEAEVHVALRELMNEVSGETRYGAFRALSILDPHDPFIRGEKPNDEFLFHVVDTSGPPMVHVTHRRKSEVVIFGADQKFQVPMVLRAGPHILITSAPGSTGVTISRYEVGKPDEQREVSQRVSDVIRTVAELGGTYPEIVSMLIQADTQHNLPGQLGIDSIPQAGRLYLRPQSEDAPGSQKARIGREQNMPNLFDSLQAPVDEDDSMPALVDPEPGAASAVDLTDRTTEGRELPEDPGNESKPAKPGFMMKAWRFFTGEAS